MRPSLLALALTATALSATPAGAGDLPSTETARYRVTFQATWSQATHPAGWPGPSAHFSGLVGGTHDGTVEFWAPGMLASTGIEVMAELGGKSALINEVNAAIVANEAEFVLSGGGLSVSPASVSLEFDVSDDYPLVTLVSMIAPSPDWFVGVHGQSLRANGDWVDELSVDLQAYDAGTDSGTTFFAGNQDTNPAEPITLITGAPFATGVPLGQFVFTRLDTPTPAFPSLGGGLAGAGGEPSLSGQGSLTPGSATSLDLANALPNGTATLIIGSSAAGLPLLGGTLVPSPDVLVFGLPVDAAGELSLSAPWPSDVPAASTFVFQVWVEDAGGPEGYAASNAVCATAP